MTESNEARHDLARIVEDVDFATVFSKEASENLPHRYIGGQYLSQGAFGSVWRFTDTASGNALLDVAVKFFTIPTLDKEIALRSVANISLSGQTCGAPKVYRILRNSGPIPMFSSGNVITKARWAIVMELIEGTNLHDYLLANPLNVPTVMDFSLDLLTQLACLHAHSVQHNDLQAQNIMVENSADLDRLRLRIIDYGIACVQSKPDAELLLKLAPFMEPGDSPYCEHQSRYRLLEDRLLAGEIMALMFAAHDRCEIEIKDYLAPCKALEKVIEGLTRENVAERLSVQEALQILQQALRQQQGHVWDVLRQIKHDWW